MGLQRQKLIAPFLQLRFLISRLERSPGSTDDWRLCVEQSRSNFFCEPRHVQEFLCLAIERNEPEVFRYFVRFSDPPEGWEDWVSKLLRRLARSEVKVEFLKILCEEGVYVLEMAQFSNEHGLEEITSLIRQHRPDITAQFTLLQAIKFEDESVIRSLLSSGIWDEKAISVASRTRNPAVLTCLDEFLVEVGFHGISGYLQTLSPSRCSPLLEQLDGGELEFLHKSCCPKERCISVQCGTLGLQPVPKRRFHDESGPCSRGRAMELALLHSKTSARLRRKQVPEFSTRRAMALGIGLVLRSLCTNLSSSPSTTFDPLSFLSPPRILTYRLVWRDGIRAIRRLMNNAPPTTTYEMLTLLMCTFSTAAARCDGNNMGADRSQ